MSKFALQHCGALFYYDETTRLDADEDCPKIYAKQDLLEGDCPICKDRVYYWQGVRSDDSLGGLYRISKQKELKEWLKRKRNATSIIQGVDWVWGSANEFPWNKRKVLVS